MNEKTRKLVTALLVIVVFVVCLALIITGQRNVGLAGLIRMLAGLAGLIFLLWLYNRRHK